MNISGIGGGTFTVNGRTLKVPPCASVSVINNKILINGKEIGETNEEGQSIKDLPAITIEVQGNAGPITVKGNNMVNSPVEIQVKGKVEGDVSTSQGNVSCADVSGNIKTSQGSVTVKGSVGQHVKTSQGSVRCGHVAGSVEASQGRIEVDGDVKGNATTRMGSITANEIHGDVTTRMGKIITK